MALLFGCTAAAILPEGMSRERFDWLRSINAEVIATPGCESNVKEIYDKCWEIRRTRPDCVILNQFEEFGNAAWHYHVTGGIVEEVFDQCATAVSVAAAKTTTRLAAFVSATGSAGTIAAGDYLKTRHPGVRVVAVEALQCPTLLQCGFGDHRIEGIGDKHVPWIHNVRNTDMVAAIDDEQCVCLTRLFNETPTGTCWRSAATRCSWIARRTSAFRDPQPRGRNQGREVLQVDSRDVLFIPLTDSMGLRLALRYRRERGPYRRRRPAPTSPATSKASQSATCAD